MRCLMKTIGEWEEADKVKRVTQPRVSEANVSARIVVIVNHIILLSPVITENALNAELP